MQVMVRRELLPLLVNSYVSDTVHRENLSGFQPLKHQQVAESMPDRKAVGSVYLLTTSNSSRRTEYSNFLLTLEVSTITPNALIFDSQSCSYEHRITRVDGLHYISGFSKF